MKEGKLAGEGEGGASEPSCCASGTVAVASC